MPRARLSDARALRATKQVIAAAQTQVAGQVEAVEVQVEAVAAGVPPDLVTQLDDIRDRIDALEP